MRIAVIIALSTLLAPLVGSRLAAAEPASPAAPSSVAPPPAPTVSGTAPAAPPPPVAPAWAAPELRGVSVWGVLPWGGLGAGGRFALPLSIPSLLRGTRLRDNFNLELGADFLRWSYDYGIAGLGGFSYSWTEVLSVGGIMWNVWLNDRFCVYPKLDVGYAFGWYSGWSGGGARPGYGGPFADGAVGALYQLGGGLTVRAEAGSSGLRLGAGWLF
jgi:hypothetical protein